MDDQFLNPQEIQAICLDMLRLVDKICKKERISYFLSGGTLLGAVRHQGFIPWDDDVDLMMPRPDFERFLKAAPKHLGSRYALAHPRVRADYAMPWVRIWDLHTRIRHSQVQKVYTNTLFLDIFPIDGLPANSTLCDLFFKEIRARDILLKCARRKGLYQDERQQALKRALMGLTGFRSPSSWARGLDRAARRHDFMKSKYAGVCTVTHYGARERMPAEVFRGAVQVPFEGERYPAPIGYHTYLTRLYGDYMTLPPEDQRHTSHRIEATIVSEEDRQ